MSKVSLMSTYAWSGALENPRQNARGIKIISCCAPCKLGNGKAQHVRVPEQWWTERTNVIKKTWYSSWMKTWPSTWQCIIKSIQNIPYFNLALLSDIDPQYITVGFYELGLNLIKSPCTTFRTSGSYVLRVHKTRAELWVMLCTLDTLVITHSCFTVNSL